jgi:hypothetical protein
VKRHLPGWALSALLAAALLIGSVGGVFSASEPAAANSNQSTIWVGTSGSAYCDAVIRHFKNPFNYPYASTISGVSRNCFATEAIVYWGPYAADSGLQGASAQVVGGSQGDPYQSAHMLCWAVFTCSGWYWLY